MDAIPLSTVLVDLATGRRYAIVENATQLPATIPPYDDVYSALNAVGLSAGWVSFWQVGSVLLLILFALMCIAAVAAGYASTKALSISIEDAETELEIRKVIARRKQASDREIAQEARAALLKRGYIIG